MTATGLRFKSSVLICCGLMAASITVCSTAAADTQTYLDMVYGSGVQRPPEGDPILKEMGWEICALTDRGVSPDKIRDQAVYNSQSTPAIGMTMEQADLMMKFAALYLCNDKR